MPISKTITLEDMKQEILYPKFESIKEQTNQNVLEFLIKDNEKNNVLKITHKNDDNEFSTSLNRNDAETYQTEMVSLIKEYQKINESETKEKLLENLIKHNDFIEKEIIKIEKKYKEIISNSYKGMYFTIQPSTLPRPQVFTKSACDSMTDLLNDNKFDIEKLTEKYFE